MQNDVLVLISAAQNSGMQALLSQLFSDIQSVAIGLSEPSACFLLLSTTRKLSVHACASSSCAFHFVFCTDFTNFGGSTVASSVSNIMQLYQEVPGLLSSRDSSGVGQVVILPITLEADMKPGPFF